MLNIFLRTVLIYLILALCIRLMGKRSLGDLQPNELVTTILISNIAVLPMEEPDMPLLSAILPIAVIAAMEILYAPLSLHFPKLRRLANGSPVVVIHNGVIDQKNLRRLRCTIDDLYASMRQAGYFDITEIDYAVAETTGNISFLPHHAAAPVTAKTMGLKPQKTLVPFLLISDGVRIRATAEALSLSDAWIDKVLKSEGVTQKQVFLMTVDQEQHYTVIRRQNR